MTQLAGIGYFTIELLPTTVLFLVVFVFHIGATSGLANGFLFYSQVISSPNYITLVQIGWEKYSILSEHKVHLLSQLLKFLYGVWNMDFSWIAFDNGVCLGKSLTGIDVVALKYITALYPLILAGVTYTIIELHARNCRILVYLWKPFCLPFTRLRQSWHARTSVIDAFATFILVSYSRFLQVSYALLTPSGVFNHTGGLQQTVVMYDPGTPFWGPEHIPYAILSIAILSTFGLLPPILLMLYPFKSFQRLLNALKVNKAGLRVFIDAFQGCYKNGQNGEPDRRFFAGLYFVFRITIFGVFAMNYEKFHSFTYLQYTYLAFLLTFVFLQPYKETRYNCLDASLMALLIFLNTTMFRCYSQEVAIKSAYCDSLPTLYATLLLPFTIMMLYVVFRFLACFVCVRNCCRAARKLLHSNRLRLAGSLHKRRADTFADAVTPDRIEHPDRYQQLAWSNEESGAAASPRTALLLGSPLQRDYKTAVNYQYTRPETL